MRIGEWRYSSTHSLNSALYGGVWPASCPGRFTPRERAPDTHRIGGWVGPRAVMDVVKRKIPSPRREMNPRISVVQTVAQRYTDWVITAPFLEKVHNKTEFVIILKMTHRLNSCTAFRNIILAATRSLRLIQTFLLQSLLCGLQSRVSNCHSWHVATLSPAFRVAMSAAESQQLTSPVTAHMQPAHFGATTTALSPIGCCTGSVLNSSVQKHIWLSVKCGEHDKLCTLNTLPLSNLAVMDNFLMVTREMRAVIPQLVQRWATGWTIGVLGFDSRQGLGTFLFTTGSRTALGPT
jgi:hypothetical protein